MGFIGSLFSGDKGAGFQAQGAPIERPVGTGYDANGTGRAGEMSQNTMADQQALVNALTAQNGIGNQSASFEQQQALANQLGGLNGAGNSSEAFNNMRFNNAQLQNIVNGTGPNPAQAQLANATGANVANQAALMASQRGAGANAGLLARQAAQQGAATQQQAVGQGAALQAQQSLGALGQQAAVQQGMQNAAQNQIAQQASQQANVANQAGQMVNQQAAAQAQAVAQRQQEQAMLLNQINAQNNAGITMAGNMNNANAGIAAGNAQQQGGILGGALNGLGSVGGVLAKGIGSGGGGSSSGGGTTSATNSIPGGIVSGSSEGTTNVAYKGGQVVGKYAEGGQVESITPVQGPQSNVGQILTGNAQVNPGQVAFQPMPTMPAKNGSSGDIFGGLMGGAGSLMNGIGGGGGGGTQMTGAGGAIGSSSSDKPIGYATGMGLMDSNKAKGGMIKGETYASEGKVIPGKAKVKGDSLKNDTVPAMLSPGEVIIPRHIMESDDPATAAARFVQAVLAKNGLKKS